MATAALNIYPNRFAKSNRLARLAANRRVVAGIYWAAIGTLVLVLSAVALLHGLELLKNAGIMPTSGAISGLSAFITKVMDTVKWFALTAVGLVACVIAAMFILGHQSAHSHGMRAGFGIIFLICIPGLVA